MEALQLFRWRVSDERVVSFTHHFHELFTYFIHYISLCANAQFFVVNDANMLIEGYKLWEPFMKFFCVELRDSESSIIIGREFQEGRKYFGILPVCFILVAVSV